MSREDFPCEIEGIIDSKVIELGAGCVVSAGAHISGKNGAAERVKLGDFCYIGPGVRIMSPYFEIGDYSKIHSRSTGHGGNPLIIGRNCWIGPDVILDCNGGLTIDDNVGIGAQSQIWTHMQFGDVVEGCRFCSSKNIYIPKDVWFVGHCIVSPVTIGERSMALAGSVITREMAPNHVYGGVPATDLTNKLGMQFQNRSIKQKFEILRLMIDEFVAKNPVYEGKLDVVMSMNDRVEGVTYFDVSTRKYTKNYHEAEVSFLKAHVPLIKFTPMTQIGKPTPIIEPFE